MKGFNIGEALKRHMIGQQQKNGSSSQSQAKEEKNGVRKMLEQVKLEGGPVHTYVNFPIGFHTHISSIH